ncbi:uncharacterized protein [Montipora foliosa]|uniref:uncharacterized protein isoform X1 n=2 Tax=Montipora foliosa TaxID=591990 RepID=UPI0035F13E4D
MILNFYRLFYVTTCGVAVCIASVLVPKPKNPKVFRFGWPLPVLVNVSMETVPLEGLVHYQLLYDDTTDSCEDYDKAISHARRLDNCCFVKNQSSASGIMRSLNCIICNSTANCNSLGMVENEYFALWFIASVKTQNTSSYNMTCIGRTYFDLVVILPRSVQIIETERRELSVSWERPHEITYEVWSTMACRVMLYNDKGQSGKCSKFTRRKQGNITTHIFKSILPWTEYSATVCCAFHQSEIHPKSIGNEFNCTCGDPPYIIPAGPVSIKTQPKEPTKKPDLQLCKASCADNHLNVTLTWGVRDQEVWNGIPTKSNIAIWKNARPKKWDNVMDIPLPKGYNGSLVSHTLVNLEWNETYHVSLRFCSNGGCGPPVNGTVSCNECVRINAGANSDTPSAKPVSSESPRSSSIFVISLSACSSILVIVLVFLSVFIWRREKRKQNRLPLQQLLRPEDVLPDDYNEIAYSNLSGNNGLYSQVIVTDAQMPTHQTQEMI